MHYATLTLQSFADINMIFSLIFKKKKIINVINYLDIKKMCYIYKKKKVTWQQSGLCHTDLNLQSFPNINILNKIALLLTY